MKIFIGPTEIAGIVAGLCAGFHRINVNAEAVLKGVHPFGYQMAVRQNWLLSTWCRLGTLSQNTPRSRVVRKSILAFLERLFSLPVLVFCLHRFDVFIFIFGQTITNTEFELRLLKAFNKRVIFVYLGSDARPPYIDGAALPAGRTVDPGRVRHAARKIKRRLTRQEHYADVCINSPTTGQFHEKRFINWFAMGFPKNVVPLPYGAESPVSNQRIRILHSPSNPMAKGTPAIRQILQRLIAKGHPIEFVQIEGMSNSIVLKELARCDLVVDQLYSDTPMAGFAAEAAHFGKPAVVGGYFAPVMHTWIRAPETPPSCFVHPGQMEAAIEALVVDARARRQLGQRARCFVQTQWSSEAVARRFLRLIENDIPSEWWVDPRQIRYVHGVGCPGDHARQLVTGLVRRFGPCALEISDKPELLDRFLKFALGDGEKACS